MICPFLRLDFLVLTLSGLFASFPSPPCDFFSRVALSLLPSGGELWSLPVYLGTACVLSAGYAHRHQVLSWSCNACTLGPVARCAFGRLIGFARRSRVQMAAVSLADRVPDVRPSQA